MLTHTHVPARSLARLHNHPRTHTRSHPRTISVCLSVSVCVTLLTDYAAVQMPLFNVVGFHVRAVRDGRAAVRETAAMRALRAGQRQRHLR